MGQKKHPFRLTLSKKAAAGTNDLAQGRIQDGRLYCIQHVAIENQTSAYTNLRIFTSGGAGEFLLEEEYSPQAATLYWMTDDVYVPENQYLVCRLTGCTADDVLKAYITGWWIQARDIPT